MVCARLGITDLEFRRLIAAQKVVVDRTNEGNYALYSEGQVKVLINRKIDGSLFDFGDPSSRTANLVVRSPEDAIRVFDLIDKGMPLQRIVLEAKLDPRIVDQVAAEYDKLSKAMSIPVAIMDQINKLQHLPATFPIRTPTDILETLRECEAERLCPSCRKAQCANACTKCIEEVTLARAGENMPLPEEAAIQSAISACIITIESKPQRTWTRDEIVGHLRALLTRPRAHLHADADPPPEPPGIRSRFHGLQAPVVTPDTSSTTRSDTTPTDTPATNPVDQRAPSRSSRSRSRSPLPPSQ